MLSKERECSRHPIEDYFGPQRWLLALRIRRAFYRHVTKRWEWVRIWTSTYKFSYGEWR